MRKRQIAAYTLNNLGSLKHVHVHDPKNDHQTLARGFTNTCRLLTSRSAMKPDKNARIYVWMCNDTIQNKQKRCFIIAWRERRVKLFVISFAWPVNVASRLGNSSKHWRRPKLKTAASWLWNGSLSCHQSCRPTLQKGLGMGKLYEFMCKVISIFSDAMREQQS